ncbi:MAG TPA: putative toxin-antitoxin system toxin component, PIN family [Desulfotomaculum sp.]|nr:putative toxin-antitoxin system toxin component, PIN family [Desulfotomaculum sp.]
MEPTKELRICRDAKDDKFLELAVSGRAAYLISGDNDLRSLNPFCGIAIVTAAGFLAATSGEETV